MSAQDAELELFYKDFCDLMRILPAISTHEFSGYLTLALFPVITFVVEESHNLLKTRKTSNFSSTLFEDYGRAIKKTRALLKLFDDSDGGRDGLLQSLNLYQEKSSEWMNIGKSGIKGWISKLLQPDIGIYFLKEDPIYMTVVGFSVMGMQKEEIESLSENKFNDLSQQLCDYGLAVGCYFSALDEFFTNYSFSNAHVSPLIIPADFLITHNDFRHKALYKKIAIQAGLKEVTTAPSLFHILTQVNTAYSLLPYLLPSDSNLLIRMQFITAYHTARSLFKLKDISGYEFVKPLINDGILEKIQNIVTIRNVLAHYGLRETKNHLAGNDDVLDDVIRGLSGMSKMDLASIAVEQLNKISIWTRERYSKTQLKKVRALFGSHT